MKTYDASNFKNIPAPEPSNWIVQGLFKTHQKRPSLFVGLAETGKSTLAVQLAVNVMQGAPFLGRATQKSRVVFWKYEDSAMDTKADFIKAGWRDGDPLILLIPDPGDQNLACLAEALAANPDTRLVIVETILDFLAIQDSNSTESVKKEMKKFNDKITSQYPNCVFLLLHHLNKGDTSADSRAIVQINGSHAFATTTAAKLYMHRVSDEDPRRYVHASVRRGEDLEPTYLVFDKDTGTSTLGETRYTERTRLKAQGREGRDQDLTTRIVAVAIENPGLVKGVLADKVGGNRQKALANIDQLLSEKVLNRVNGVSSRGGTPPQLIYVSGQEVVTAPMSDAALFESFEHTTRNPKLMRAFYDGRNNDEKVLIWNQFPEHQEALKGRD